jgi:hypothetical protein
LYNNENVAYFTMLNNDVQYQIFGIDGALEIENQAGNSLKVGSQFGSLNSNELVSLKSGIYMISNVVVDFGLSQSHDWSAVTFGIDLVEGKSFVNNLNPIDAPGADSTHSLYIPKQEGQDGAFICPNATELSEVFIGCAGGYSVNVGNPNLTVETIDNVDYWKVDGLTGTGGLGKYLSGQSFEILPDSSDVNETLEVNLLYQSLGGFVSGDKIQFTFEPTAGFVLQNNCIVPTNDADGNFFVDGAGVIVNSNIYEYTFSSSVIGPANLSFCVNITAPANKGAYSVILSDDNSSFGSTLFYVGDDNKLFMSAHVPPSISLNIRTIDDLSETNSCAFGTIDSSTLIPNYDNIVDSNRGECGYGIAVSTNSPEGFVIQVQANTGLVSGTDEIASINNGDSFIVGKEGYGFASITSSTKGRNLTTGQFTESIIREGVFGLGTASIPQTNEIIFSYPSTTEYLAGGDNTDLNLVIHGLVVGSGTPAGFYNQSITYTVTPIF